MKITQNFWYFWENSEICQDMDMWCISFLLQCPSELYLSSFYLYYLLSFWNGNESTMEKNMFSGQFRKKLVKVRSWLFRLVTIWNFDDGFCLFVTNLLKLFMYYVKWLSWFLYGEPNLNRNNRIKYATKI